MESDLQDALIAWQDGDISPERKEELLTRLREDTEFRKAFAEKLWTLSSSRVARSPEPRWLELMEEIGADDEDELVRSLGEQIRREPVRFVPVWWRLVAGVAMALLVVAGAMLLWSSRTTKSDGPPLAVLVTPGKNSLVSTGKIRIQKQTAARLLFTTGVIVDIEGPARLDLVSRERIRCSEGRLRTFVPKGAEGFTVETPEGEIRDLGTELGIVVGHGKPSQISVLDGEAEISVQVRGQDGIRSALLRKNDAAEFEAETGSIRPGDMGSDFPVVSPALPTLRLPENYSDIILASSPKLYWRLDRLSEDGTVPNEIAGGATLHITGGVAVENGRMAFHGKNAPGALLMTESWSTPPDRYAVELWFATDQIGRMDLVALTPAESATDHLALVEVGGFRPHQGDEPGVLRHLMRWPPGRQDGMNLYSPPLALPYLWHHVVAQQENGRMELYLNGEPRGIAELGENPQSTSARWQFGCLLALPGDSPKFLQRVFSGQMAEIAVYDRLLSKREIQARFEAARTK